MKKFLICFGKFSFVQLLIYSISYFLYQFLQFAGRNLFEKYACTTICKPVTPRSYVAEFFWNLGSPWFWGTIIQVIVTCLVGIFCWYLLEKVHFRKWSLIGWTFLLFLLLEGSIHSHIQYKRDMTYIFEMKKSGEWIDCMPSLTKDESRLCRLAEEYGVKTAN